MTEDEIQRGIIKAKDPTMHCYWFKRNIYDLKEHVADKMARNFIDKLSDGELDTEANKLVEKLKNEVSNVLGKENVSVYDIKWQPDAGVDAKASKQHAGYLDLLCRDFYRVLKGMIESGIKARWVQSYGTFTTKDLERVVTATRSAVFPEGFPITLCVPRLLLFYGTN